MWGSGFGVGIWGSGSRVWGLGFRVQGAGFRVWGSGCSGGDTWGAVRVPRPTGAAEKTGGDCCVRPPGLSRDRSAAAAAHPKATPLLSRQLHWRPTKLVRP